MRRWLLATLALLILALVMPFWVMVVYDTRGMPVARLSLSLVSSRAPVSEHVRIPTPPRAATIALLVALLLLMAAQAELPLPVRALLLCFSLVATMFSLGALISRFTAEFRELNGFGPCGRVYLDEVVLRGYWGPALYVLVCSIILECALLIAHALLLLRPSIPMNKA